MKKNVKQGIQLLVFLSIGTIILYYVYSVQAKQYLAYCTGLGNEAGDCGLIDKILADYRKADLRWLGLTIILYMISNISRALRWKMLIEAKNEPIRFGNAFFSTMIGYFANLAIPRLGEFVRAGFLARYEKIDAANVMGTVVTDRILDVLGLLFIFGLGFIFGSGPLLSYLQENAVLPALSPTVIFMLLTIAVVLLLMVYFLYRRFRNHPTMDQLILKLRNFIAGVASIRKVKNFPMLIFHSFNIYLMYYLMTYLPFFSFEFTSGLSPVAGLLVFIFGGLGMVIPSPGGMGTYHALIIAALSIFGVAGPDGFSFAMVVFLTINIGVNFLMGIFSLVIMPLYNKNYK